MSVGLELRLLVMDEVAVDDVLGLDVGLDVGLGVPEHDVVGVSEGLRLGVAVSDALLAAVKVLDGVPDGVCVGLVVGVDEGEMLALGV